MQLPSLVLISHSDVIANESLKITPGGAASTCHRPSATLIPMTSIDLHRTHEPVSLSNDEANSSRLKPRTQRGQKYLLQG